jgi:hypothetical protein
MDAKHECPQRSLLMQKKKKGTALITPTVQKDEEYQHQTALDLNAQESTALQNVC